MSGLFWFIIFLLFLVMPIILLIVFISVPKKHNQHKKLIQDNS